MLLAAANPDITGPLVINGAPMAYWSGHVGESPMRYNGGLLGGALPALLMSDLGHGQFDGAHLVSNFEMLNPGRNLFGKYYDLFANIDNQEARDSFLEFERWWGVTTSPMRLKSAGSSSNCLWATNWRGARPAWNMAERWT